MPLTPKNRRERWLEGIIAGHTTLVPKNRKEQWLLGFVNGQTTLVPKNRREEWTKALIDAHDGGGWTHPNLLDNSYFINPLNENGQTSYTGNVDTINRWKTTNANSTLTIESDCVELTAASAGNAFFRQYLSSTYEGTYTYSAYVRGSGSGYIGINVNNSSLTVLSSENFSNPGADWVLISGTFTTSNQPIGVFTIRENAGSSIQIKAAKLEIGTTSTLPDDRYPVYA